MSTRTIRVTVAWPYGSEENNSVETVEIDSTWTGDVNDHPDVQEMREQLIFERVDSWAEEVES